VVGGITAKCGRQAASVVGRIAARIHQVGSAEAAELAKLWENTFRAVNIALANELADLCRPLGLNVMEVIRAAATKPYGFMAFYPGPGVGGHCIPCDPHYLLWQLRAVRTPAPIIEEAMAQIAARPSRVVDQAVEFLALAGVPLRAARVLIVGVTYKPGVADVRESPALEIISRLRRLAGAVSYHDPLVPSVRVAGCGQLFSEPQPDQMEWDLVLVHTVQPGSDLAWLTRSVRVLDCTYRLESMDRMKSTLLAGAAPP
jgi:nucleotide sugar dehydrogenase